jgi:hypothetical protein
MTGARPTEPPTTGDLAIANWQRHRCAGGSPRTGPAGQLCSAAMRLGREVLFRRCSAGSAVQFVEGVDGLHDGGGVRAEVAGAAVVNQRGEGS